MDRGQLQADGTGPASTVSPVEPRLADLLEDEPMRLLMARDGVYREDILALVRRVGAGRLSSPGTEWAVA